MTSTISPSAERAGVLLRGARQPRVRQVPEYASSAGQEAIELAALAGLVLDPWEADVLVDALGEREDGKWAAFEVGTTVPRQNGKGSILEARELAGAILFSERLLIHSAHEQATSSEHFRRLLQLIEEADFQRRIRKVVKGKGAEAIEFFDGTRILFKTRTGGGGRGLTGDFVGLDEAMILPVATTAALVPTMAARSIHGNPQLWYAGSAVDRQVHEHGIVLARLRERALKALPRIAYFEFSVEGDNPDDVPDSVLDDPAAWAQANPGFGIRISQEHIANERAGALGRREFAVERLGVGDWPDTDVTAGGVLKLDAWRDLTDPASKPVGTVCFSLDVPPDRSYASIGVAGRRGDQLEHVEIVDRRPGTGWVVDRIVELLERHDAADEVVLDAAGPAGSLVPDLEAAGVKVRAVTAKEHAQACGGIFDAIEQRAVRHLGTPELDAAVKGAAKRPLGDAWAWSRKSSGVDISPLVAITLAAWWLAAVSESVYESRGVLVV
jgi:hypothetical protein